MIYYKSNNSPFDTSGDDFIIIIDSNDDWDNMISNDEWWIYDLSGVDRLKDYHVLSNTSIYKNKTHYLIK